MNHAFFTTIIGFPSNWFIAMILLRRNFGRLLMGNALWSMVLSLYEQFGNLGERVPSIDERLKKS